MNAGKSTSLLQIAYNYEEQGQKSCCTQPASTTAAVPGRLFHRLGLQRSAFVFDKSTHFSQLLKSQDDLACVLIDESQFPQPDQVAIARNCQRTQHTCHRC